MKLSVDVTADDIRLGQKQSTDSCPIARALKRAWKATNVEVAPTEDMDPTITVDGIDVGFGHEVVTFAERFDNDKVVKPRTFVFELNG
jgi:hypothetical protein